MISLKKILLLGGLALAFNSTFGQNGSLRIFVQDNGYSETDSLWTTLFQNDSVIREDFVPVYEYHRFKKLQPGVYKLLLADPKGIDMTYDSLIVKEGEQLVLEVSIPWEWYCDDCDSTEGEDYFRFEANFEALLGIPELPIDFVENHLSLSVNSTTWPLVGRHASIGYMIGAKLDISNFNKDTFFTGSAPHETEKYTNLGLTIGPMFRLAAFDLHKEYSKGAFLDVGAYYSLPIYFRYAAVNGDSKTLESNLHRFNEFHAMARLGYLPFSFKLDYRITDILKKEFPQPPPLTFGISYVVDY